MKAPNGIKRKTKGFYIYCFYYLKSLKRKPIEENIK